MGLSNLEKQKKKDLTNDPENKERLERSRDAVWGKLRLTEMGGIGEYCKRVTIAA